MVNVHRCQLDESLDRSGFRHAAASLGQRLGASRVGAAVYEAQAGHQIWPYHYHYAVEEWAYVIAGAPVLRDAGGTQTLQGGDLVCFPPGPGGLHALSGPGRFLLASTDAPGPYAAVYPDSDKTAIALGGRLGAVTFPLAAAVDYWSGEGSEPAGAPVEVEREPAAPSRPVVNALTAPAGALAGLGAQRLAAAALVVAPGDADDGYRYAYGGEEWLLVLAGTPSLRHPDGEDLLEPGDLVCFAEGPAGARQLTNRSDATVRALVLATTELPLNVHYPESGTWSLRNRPGDADLVLGA
jgi:uncharacterized cupin superfamily protein